MIPRLLLVALWVLAAAPAAAQPSGAASCSGCHAGAGPVPGLEGRPAAEIAAAMAAFRSGERPATVMDRIAKGFTDDETRAIAEWLAGRQDHARP
ncbi:MAG: c-type cytochrome [Inquilinus limosus]|uniref:C-type cytochrome n=1 Tax=Inquilinus limosus TaxID=171674 RepID=A0A952KI37_9PROT|nr:c-type cytochrome [Inquilinus limosus]